MSKILKAILIGAYGALIIQFMRTFNMTREETLIEINYVYRPYGPAKKLQKLVAKWAKEMKINYTQMIPNYKKPERLPTDLKYILKFSTMYNSGPGYRYDPFTKGQQAFIEAKCEHKNCFFTTERKLIIDIRNFDAIVFDVNYIWEPHPPFRSLHQKYIFTAIEPNDYFPVCDPHYDNYYNWTWTYRLDSDIVWTHFTIYDNNNTIVGPKINMTWIESMAPPPQKVIDIVATKKKMVAWFVSNCNTKNDRMNLSDQIDHHLKKYGFKVDVFGRCGSIICPKDRMDDCLELLQRNYYFYLAFEGTKSIDYVSNKVLHALDHYTVPIVYGEADYSRFLPPGSYINAKGLEPSVIASLMIDLVNNDNKKKYYDCFRWRNHYIYKESPEVTDVCLLCKLLNEQKDPTVVKSLRQWWHPDYRTACTDSNVEMPVAELVKRSKRYRRKSEFL